MSDFLLICAKTMKEKADKEASAGVQSAAKYYQAAATKYRQAATKYPEESEIYLALAKECEELANNVSVNVYVQPGFTDKRRLMGFMPPIKNYTVEEVLEELDSLVGLDSVKKQIKTWIGLLKAYKRRKDAGI